MGHKIGKEMIDPGVKDHIMSFVGNVADLETEVNTDIISAVNSLIADRVDNVENIGKLAEAIGEPVTASDTIDEVVDGLGEMLSTFKTNMMNSGVTVESNDKFKSLIDKIATMVEEGEGKGIQFAEGTWSMTITASSGWTQFSFIDIDFDPTLVILRTYSTTYGLSSEYNIIDSSIHNSESEYGTLSSGYDWTPGCYISGKTVFASNSADYDCSYNVKWYAIGVGEEDTTLRDSLASILQEEGITVTEEDDMASLISKVDSEFDRKTTEMESNKGLDIISATELPATGKENQICVITDNPTDTILLTSSVADVQSEGINIYLGNSSSSDVSMGTLVPISTNGITMNYYFNRIYQGSNRLASYYYINNTWTPLTNKYIPIFEDGAITTTELNTGLNMDGASVTNGELILDASADGYYYLIYSKNKINFSDISKIEVVLKKNYVDGNYNPRIYVGASDNPSTYSNNVVAQAQKDLSSTSYTTWTIDTSLWTGTHYFIIQKYNEYSGLRCYIQSIRIY